METSGRKSAIGLRCDQIGNVDAESACQLYHLIHRYVQTSRLYSRYESLVCIPYFFGQFLLTPAESFASFFDSTPYIF